MRAWAALAAAILVSGTVPAQVLPAPVPAVRSPATAPESWRPLFATDFSGSELPRQCEPYDGPQGGVAASYYRPDEVAVADGLLQLTMRRRDFGGRPYTTGGVGCHQVVQTYGRYEFRAKVPAGAGIDSYITLWPADAGNDKDATLVEIMARPGDGKAYLTNQYGSGSSQVTAAGSYSDDFHTYTIEWAPTSLRILVDGVPRMTDSHVSLKRKWIGFAMSSGDALTGVPDASTALPATFQVDFLRVYAYDPSANPIGGAAPMGPPPAAGPPATASSAVRRFLVLTLGAGVAVTVVALTAVGYARLRARRRLRPAHRA